MRAAAVEMDMTVLAVQVAPGVVAPVQVVKQELQLPEVQIQVAVVAVPVTTTVVLEQVQVAPAL